MVLVKTVCCDYPTDTPRRPFVNYTKIFFLPGQFVEQLSYPDETRKATDKKSVHSGLPHVFNTAFRWIEAA
jgi:hypothetical protein